MQARAVAETGARAALEALAVAEAQPYEHMDGAQRALRLGRSRVDDRGIGRNTTLRQRCSARASHAGRDVHGQ